MSVRDEPLLEVDDIQGHVLVGFRGDHQRVIGFRLIPGQTAAARAVLLPWVDRVTSTRHAAAYRQRLKASRATGMPPELLDSVLLTIAFTALGLAAFGVPDGPEDPDFGLGASSAAAALGDVVDPETGVPVGWKYGDIPERTPHLLAIFGAKEEPAVAHESDRLIGDLRGLAELVVDELGKRIPGDKEHFGFVDGISQPAPRGRVDDDVALIHRSLPAEDPASNLFAVPGRPLVWPGQYVFGYPMQLADSPAPGPVAGGTTAFLRNGSLLVLRRLSQDVGAFWTGMANLASTFSEQGVKVDAKTAAAWCVGRWPDGTPLVLSPDANNPEIADDPYRRNGFVFRKPLAPAVLTKADGTSVSFPGAAGDAVGTACPFFAHVRKVNPRDDAVDFGSSGVTLQFQMLRRGIPFGKIWPGQNDGEERGLLFISYQTSIANQFHQLMTRWVNEKAAPLPGSGIDPLIGVDAPQGRGLQRRKPDGTFARALLSGTWVRATGAVYAFTPGIGTLRRIIAG
jgi:deferrochelatase/peroxidase EfeB